MSYEMTLRKNARNEKRKLFVKDESSFIRLLKDKSTDITIAGYQLNEK